MTVLLDKIRKSEDIQNILDLLYDFTLIQPTADSLKRGFSIDQPVLCIATDACGGTYALLGEGDDEKRPVLFVSSEGQAGVLAPCFNDFMALVLTMPFWMDVLKYSRGGKLPEMKKAFQLLNRESDADMNELLEDDGDKRSYRTVQRWMFNTLELKEVGDPVERLYDAVFKSPGINCCGKKDKRQYTSLFSSYGTADNPLWKKK